MGEMAALLARIRRRIRARAGAIGRWGPRRQINAVEIEMNRTSLGKCCDDPQVPTTVRAFGDVDGEHASKQVGLG